MLLITNSSNFYRECEVWKIIKPRSSKGLRDFLGRLYRNSHRSKNFIAKSTIVVNVIERWHFIFWISEEGCVIDDYSTFKWLKNILFPFRDVLNVFDNLRIKSKELRPFFYFLCFFIARLLPFQKGVDRQLETGKFYLLKDDWVKGEEGKNYFDLRFLFVWFTWNDSWSGAFSI